MLAVIYKLLTPFLAMAGNIIPAIATTNAVIAGIVVMQAYKILNGQLSETKRVRANHILCRPYEIVHLVYYSFIRLI
jgi:hypothetical protein